ECGAIGGWTVLSVATSDDGALWLRMRGRALIAYRDGAFEDLMAAHHQPQETIVAMSSQPGGSILIAGYKTGVLRFRQGRFATVVPLRMLPDSLVISIAETDRGVWVGTSDAGLLRFDGKTIEQIEGLSPHEK